MNTKLKQPVNCHLWKKPDLKSEDLRFAFEAVETYVDESHLFRRLLKCKDCGQLYFYEFYETIDWEGGNDPQYKTFIPVETKEEIELLKNTDMYGLMKFRPSLRSDFPEDADAPNVYWLER